MPRQSCGSAENMASHSVELSRGGLAREDEECRRVRGEYRSIVGCWEGGRRTRYRLYTLKVVRV